MDPEGDRSLIERFVADEMPDTEEEAMNRFLTDEIEQALSTLPPRDAKVCVSTSASRRSRAHARRDRLDARRHARACSPTPRSRSQRLREGDVGRALGSFAA